MTAPAKLRAASAGRWIACVGMSLVLVPMGAVRAQSPTTPPETAPSKGAAAPLPGNLTALLPKSRQLLHDGDLRAAERVAQFDVKYHSNVSQLAGSLEALTSIYKQSGRYEEALATGARYQQVLETIPNADPSKRQDMALLLAEVLAGVGKYPPAVAHVDDALKIRDGWRKTDPLWEPHAYAVRAQIERAAGQSDAASADWREVESRTRRILDQVNQSGPNVDLEESALKLLTEALVSTDRAPEAIAVREQFLARHQDDQTRARNWSEIAKCYAILRQRSQEAQALRTALDLESRSESLDNPRRSRAEEADLLDRLGLVLEQEGDLETARSQWKEAAAIYQRLVDEPASRRQSAEKQFGYAAKLLTVFEQLHRWKDAIRVGQHLLKQRSQTLLPEDPKLWRLKSTLGNLYARASDREKARSLLTDALDYWRHRVPTATVELAQTLAQLSKLSLAEGDRQQAAAYAEEAVTAYSAAPVGHELQLAEAYDSLGDVLAAEGKTEKAIGTYQQAAQICRGRENDRRAGLLLCGTLVDIAAVYKSQEEYGRAAEYCAQALEVRKRTPNKDSRALIGLYTTLAALQLAADQSEAAGKKDGGELAQAEANLAAARQLCAQHGWLEGPAGIGVLELEAVVDVRHEKPDAAKKLLDEALALSRRSQLSNLEAKIQTNLTQLEQRYGLPSGGDATAK